MLNWLGHIDESARLLAQVIPEYLATPHADAYFLLTMLPQVFHQKDYERATAYLSLLLNDPQQYPVFAEDPNLASLKQRLQHVIDADVFNTAWERGKSLDLAETVQALVDALSADLPEHQ